MATLAETPSVVEMKGVGVIAQELEGLVMVPVHVAHEEIKHSHVHEVK